jgi:hypothetical protein
MKKIKIYSCAIGLLLFYSCNKLKETPYSSIYTQNFYSNATEAEAAITAVYGGLYNLYTAGATIFVPEWSADIMFPRNVVARSSLTLYTYDPQYSAQTSFARTNESPIEIWKQAYAGVEKANWVIAKVPTTPMDTARRNSILGEAYFFRAFFNWTLTRNFQNIVLKITPSNSIANSYVGKSDQKAVYQQIYKDLILADSLLPDYTPTIVKGRVSRQVAQLLFAKAALYDQNWPVALTMAQTVINSGKYTLMPNFADAFDVSKKDAARQENMFAVELSSSLNPSRFSQVAYYFAPISAGAAYNKGPAGAMYAFQSFYNSFAPNDGRRALLDTSFPGVPQVKMDTRLLTKNLVAVGKYKDPNAIGSLSNNNIPILRYADAFLIAAEAEAMQNGASGLAYSYVNTIRTRAHIPGLTAGLSKQDFVDSVLVERAKEFYGEGDRWYDLTRTNTFLTVIPTAINADYPVRTPLPKHRYFPIPQLEINANPELVQNPDWQ